MHPIPSSHGRTRKKKKKKCQHPFKLLLKTKIDPSFKFGVILQDLGCCRLGARPIKTVAARTRFQSCQMTESISRLFFI